MPIKAKYKQTRKLLDSKKWLSRRNLVVVALIAGTAGVVTLLYVNAATDCSSSSKPCADDTNEVGSQQWQLDFHDEFNGTSLDGAKWKTLRGGGAPDGPAAGYPNYTLRPYSSAENVFYKKDNPKVTNGEVTFTLSPEHLEEGPFTYDYTSGLIQSGPTYTFGPPAYVEARIKVPKCNGCWSLFWTLPLPIGTWPPEFDIFEFFQYPVVSYQKLPYFNYHWPPGDNHLPPSPYGDTKVDYTGEYHTYGMYWDGKKAIPYLDGVAYPARAATQSMTSLNMYLIFQLSAGRKYPVDGNGIKQMSIDWVRVWKPKKTVEDNSPPDTTINNVTVSNANATATFSSNEAGSSFECNLDNAVSWKACSSPQQYTNLVNGSHTLKVRAKDAAGNTDQSPATKTFTISGTNPPPTDTTAPQLTITSPANNAIVSGNTTINANASDNVGITKVEFSVDNTLKMTDTATPYNYSINTLSYPNGNHTVKVIAYDAAGNTKTANLTLNIQNADITPPNSPASLSGNITQPTTDSTGKVSLSWPAASDNPGGSGIKAYLIYRNDKAISFVAANQLSYIDTNLSTGTYSYTIRSLDYADLTSTTASPVFKATLNAPPQPDTQAPSVPAGLTAASPAPTQVNLSWKASTDNGGSGIAGYNVYRNGSNTPINSQLITTTSFGDGTVDPETAYSYQIEAVDGAGNKSSKSSSVSTTTKQVKRSDLNGDNTINIFDLSRLAANWQKANPTRAEGDINGDGKIDVFDLSMIASDWGEVRNHRLISI